MEKSNLMIFFIFAPALFFFVGFWIAGFIFTKRWSPLKAILGFFGGWIVGAILMFCYIMFASKSSGNAMTLLIAGALVAVFAVSVFVSAIYRTSILNGVYIFVCQLFLGFGLAFGLSVYIEKKVDPQSLDQKSEDWLFRPVGILGKLGVEEEKS